MCCLSCQRTIYNDIPNVPSCDPSVASAGIKILMLLPEAVRITGVGGGGGRGGGTQRQHLCTGLPYAMLVPALSPRTPPCHMLFLALPQTWRALCLPAIIGDGQNFHRDINLISPGIRMLGEACHRLDYTWGLKPGFTAVCYGIPALTVNI